MATFFKLSRKPSGAALLFVIISLVIMAILGAAMVSIYSDAKVGEATRNDARRAYYMAESGYRYALSEIRNSINPDTTAQEINSRDKETPPYEYTVSGDQRFRVNLFKLFALEAREAIVEGAKYAYIQDPDPNAVFPDELEFPGDLNLVMGIPPGYTGDPEDIFPQALNVFEISSEGWTVEDGGRTLKVPIKDAADVPEGTQLLLAVRGAVNQDITQGGNLEVLKGAKIFPESGGIIGIKDKEGLKEYSYERIKCEGATCTLYGLQKPRGGTWRDSDNLKNIGNDDYIIYNSYGGDCYVCTSRGYAGDTTEEIIVADICKTAIVDEGPDIDHNEYTTSSTPISSNPNALYVDENKNIRLGGNLKNAFGVMWYGGNKEVNDDSTWCQDGKCKFNRGLRAFFILTVNNSTADGLTFTLMNATNNTKNSVGGDSALGELLAYSGDSRIYSILSSEATTIARFAQGDSPGGLFPPKMALEVDTWYNSNSGWCYGTPAFGNAGTRNDPQLVSTETGENSRDYLQFIFWGQNQNETYDGQYYPPCKKYPGSSSEKTYDDNKHGVSDGDIENIKTSNFTFANLSTAEQSAIPSTEQNNWLGTATNPRRWAVRFEVKRSLNPVPDGETHAGDYAYTLNMWIRKCTTADCSDIKGTEYAKTFVDYRANLPHLTQTMFLSKSQHEDYFDRTLFGFTEATGGGTQDLTLNDFELTFIRPTQRVVLDDPDWP